MEGGMASEYALLDRSTNLIHGPFEIFTGAFERAEDVEQWEILNRNDDLVDSSPKPKLVAPACVETRVMRKGTAERTRPAPKSQVVAVAQALLRRCHCDPAFRALFVAQARQLLAEQEAARLRRITKHTPSDGDTA
jgi:hypothetical protein